ncbi:MAG: hypothetical protein JNM56_25710 [Planctomycetia bacterium]|nr:hypothetical protein [Planctomycetia bacterium]
MTLHTPNLNQGGRTPDDLDGLLRSFFRSEMPDPWPTMKAPAAETPTLGWWSRSRSRLALAASVALLLIGSWLLSGSAPQYTAPVVNGPRDTSSGTADQSDLNGIRGKVEHLENKHAPAGTNTQR